MREHMVPIDYVSGSMDSFGWERVDLDSVRMGSKFDFHGLLSIEKLSGDKAEKMLRKLGHPTATGKKNKTNAGEQGEGDRDGADRGDTEDAKESHDKKSRGKVAPFLPGQKGAESGLTGEDKGEDIERNREPQKERAKKLKEGLKRHAEEGSGEEGRESAKAVKQRMVTKIVDGKVVKVAAEHAQEWSKTGEIGMKKSKNRKRKPKNKGGGAAVGEPAFDLMAGGHPYEEDEDAEANGGTDAADAAADDAAEYDDEYEYEGWGEGIMMRKCIVRALLEQGFEVPTPIQAAVLPVALGKRCDVFGAAQTGSGKTLAFALPIIQRILDSSSFNGSAEDRALAALVLSPTRELALQVKDHFERAARYTRISVVAVVGGLAVDKQRRLLARRPQVVVGTPGRLWEQMQLGDPFLTRLHMLLALVIDEADRMLEAGHFQDLENILRLLPAVDPKKRRKQADEAAPEREEGWGEAVESFARKERQERGHQERHYRRQTLVFSATLVQDQAWRRHRAGKDSKKERERVRREEREAAMSAEERRAQSVTKLMERLDLPEDPLVIDLSPAGKVSERITQHRLCCLAPDKELHIYHYLLKHLSAGGGRTLIFVNAIGEARRLANLLVCLRVRAVLLHGGLQQRQRLKNLDVFKGDRSAVLVATDLAARGLDIPAVEVVIHYHVPKVPSVYVHRCGRTARGKVLEGRSLLVMSPQETSHYNKIADVIGAEVSRHPRGPTHKRIRLCCVGLTARGRCWHRLECGSHPDRSYQRARSASCAQRSSRHCRTSRAAAHETDSGWCVRLRQWTWRSSLARRRVTRTQTGAVRHGAQARRSRSGCDNCGRNSTRCWTQRCCRWVRRHASSRQPLQRGQPRVCQKCCDTARWWGRRPTRSEAHVCIARKAAGWAPRRATRKGSASASRSDSVLRVG